MQQINGGAPTANPVHHNRLQVRYGNEFKDPNRGLKALRLVVLNLSCDAYDVPLKFDVVLTGTLYANPFAARRIGGDMFSITLDRADGQTKTDVSDPTRQGVERKLLDMLDDYLLKASGGAFARVYVPTNANR